MPSRPWSLNARAALCLKFKHQRRGFGARAADQYIAPPVRIRQNLVAMIGLALNISGEASAAIAEFARGPHRNIVSAQYVDNRLAGRNFVFAAALREPDSKWLIRAQ